MAGPLTKKDLTEISEALKGLEAVEKEIQRAKAAGLDVSDMEARAKTQRTRLTGIKQAYFPNG